MCVSAKEEWPWPIGGVKINNQQLINNLCSLSDLSNTREFNFCLSFYVTQPCQQQNLCYSQLSYSGCEKNRLDSLHSRVPFPA